MKVKLRTLKRKKEDVKLQLDLLTSDNEYRREYSRKVSERMTGINAIEDIEARYQHFRDTDGVCPASIARSRENSQTEMDDSTDTTEDGAEATR